ncbi:MAG: TonB-dependent receptor [Bacteroidales bacterium]|jgi:iron complex outermembrane receptor protein|nr:TonB-dependent receptor [Bacteroidales bacterium]NCU37055.1 TonB-dependent receptor [Candidatus Falkowbacteria bacterium]MDD3131676.1 TonB-dependent receptor [Bacteroidales bacterium]MDD4178300.1 TonB-dependent receptor [Bacteroidales bacterium]MDD4742717.1 TonB-dependent receptor [Bacteroidales bacterium]
MTKKHFMLLATLFLPGILLAQFTFSGTVRDAQSGQSLPGAHVVIDNSYHNAVTDYQGHFVMKNLPAGAWHVEVTFLGYEKKTAALELSRDTRMEFELQPRTILEEEVVITSTRLNQKTPGTWQQVGHEELKTQNLGKDLPMMLRSTPSAVVTSDAGAGVGYSGIRIRGTDITRINVTMNGIPMNDPESQGLFWVNLPDLASSVDNIQIQRGVGTSTNGAAAFGASINMQTQKLQADPYARISSSAGSYRTFKNTLSFGSGLLNGRFALDGRLSKITSNGYIDRAFSDLKSFYVSGGYYGAKTIVRVNVMSGKEKTYQAWYGIPSDSLATNRTYNPAGEYVDEQGRLAYYDNQTDNYQQDHYQLLLSQMVSRKINLNAAAFYVRGYGYYESYKPDGKFAKYGLGNVVVNGDTMRASDMITRKYLDNDFYGFTFSGNYNSFDKITASVGGGWNYYDGAHYGNVIWSKYSDSNYPDKRWYENEGLKTQFNIYGKINYQISKSLNAFVDLQMRGIHYKIEGTHDDGSDITQEHDFLFFNPKFGAMYQPGNHHQLYFSFAIANREPTRSDFRDADENHEPLAEKLTDYELGYNYSAGKVRLNMNLFYMDYKDQLVLTGEINKTGAAIFTNVPDSYRAGLELVAGINATAWLHLEANAALSRNRIKQYVAFVDNWSPPYHQLENELTDTDLSFSPDVVAGGTVQFIPIQNLSVGVVSKYVGRQYIDNTSSDKRMIDAYFVNDLNISYAFETKFFSRVELFASISNIFSAKYASNAWVYRYYSEGSEYMTNGYFPQAPINFLAGATISF